MRIAESQVSMQSLHHQSVRSETSEQLNVWDNTGSASLQRVTDLSEEVSGMPNTDTVTISEEAAASAGQSIGGAIISTSSSEGLSTDLSLEDDLKLKLLEDFLTQLLGRKVKFRTTDLLRSAYSGSKLTFGNPGRTTATTATFPIPSSGFGLTYDYSRTYRETEAVSYSAQGVIKTSDGKEISFDLNMNMSRSYHSQEEFHLQMGQGNKVDPLVINLDRPSAGLSNLRVDFDLNADGAMEEIEFLSGGSGFLALDKNGDGRINDGKELFGPNMGDGFAELSQYDSDGNNWIDENDDVFQRLTVWTKDENGKDQLLSLAAAGIGAIYLGHQETEFTYKDRANQSMAQLASTGIYLKENGSVGTIQHIDYII